MPRPETLLATVRRAWHQPVADIRAICRGVHASRWEATAGDHRFTLTRAPAKARASLAAGLSALDRLIERGIGASRAERTVHGTLTVETAVSVLALGRRAEGRPLHPADPVDARWWGCLLGAAHRALDGFDHPGLHHPAGWHGLDPGAPHLPPETRDAVARAVAAVTRLCVTDRLTYGVLHRDPSAPLFLIDPATGRTGVLGWGPAGTGPLVYDLAAAVVAADGPEATAELVDAYARAGPVHRDEIEAALPVLVELRRAALAARRPVIRARPS
ncbi:homoserine kinase type II [Catenuloplanes nepalensis]|uniref:Homoserine kinase type II n=1 Tax=Catenuloplanes nepalensis TaxID=587533 RepID=A0ABT9MKD9_9ACTN|nr:phosphotransferase [Catenuloplanes nepalensis]MDP9791888.1 homoserine kinase type II [Catenuloplanes nepalensis]